MGSTSSYGGAPTFASQAEAEAGTDETKSMNPLRSAQAIAALAAGGGGAYTLVTSEAQLDTALAAGDQLIAITSDVTLTGNKAPTAYTHFLISPEVNFSLGNFTINPGAGVPIMFSGGGSIVTAKTSGVSFDLSGGERLYLDNIRLQCGNSAGAEFASEAGEQHYNRCYISAPAVSGGLFASTNILTLTDCVIVGSSTSCQNVISAGGSELAKLTINGLELRGTFGATAMSPNARMMQVSNVIVNSDSNTTLSFGNSGSNPSLGSVRGLGVRGSGTVNVVLPQIASDIHVTGNISGKVDDGGFNLKGFSCATLTSDFYVSISSGMVSGACTITTDADMCSFSGVYFASTLTINSGANVRLVGCTIVSTLTNNDPSGSEVIGCFQSTSGAARLDQRIGVGRFNNATLDAALKNLVAYYDFSETDLNFLNKAPHGVFGKLGQVGGVTLGTGGPDGKGVVISANTKYCTATAFSLPRAASEFTLAFWVAPDDATPTSTSSFGSISDLGGSNGITTGYNATTGYPHIYANGAFRITGVSNPFTDDVMSLVVVRCYNNAGTLTYELLVDNSSIGTSTAGIITPAFYYLNVARFSTSLNESVVGELSAFMFWDKALDSSEMSALYNSGAGRFLVGV